MGRQNMSSEDIPRQQAEQTLESLVSRIGQLPEPTEEQRAARERAREEATMKMIRESRISEYRARWEHACPPALRESDWNHPRMKPFAKQISVVRNYQVNAKGLLLFGPSGRGKSRAMWDLMRRLCCDEARDVRMFTAASWFGKLQEQVRYGHDDAFGWITAIARRPLVFIDDFGQEALLASRAE